MKILVFPQHDDRWRWALHGVDGVPVALSGKAFSTSAQAMIEARQAVGCMPDAAVEEGGLIAIPCPEHIRRLAMRR